VANTTSLSTLPYWHIGDNDYDPDAGSPGPACDWHSAFVASSGLSSINTLSSFFGTDVDMMGQVLDVRIDECELPVIPPVTAACVAASACIYADLIVQTRRDSVFSWQTTSAFAPSAMALAKSNAQAKAWTPGYELAREETIYFGPDPTLSAPFAIEYEYKEARYRACLSSAALTGCNEEDWVVPDMDFTETESIEENFPFGIPVFSYVNTSAPFTWDGSKWLTDWVVNQAIPVSATKTT